MKLSVTYAVENTKKNKHPLSTPRTIARRTRAANAPRALGLVFIVFAPSSTLARWRRRCETKRARAANEPRALGLIFIIFAPSSTFTRGFCWECMYRRGIF